MKKPENGRELLELGAGFGLLVFGIALNLFTFSIAAAIVADPGGYVESLIPATVESAGPRSSFQFTVLDLSVSFEDASTAGDSPIASYSWDFGDASTSNQRNPDHTYGQNFRGVVRFTVRDNNGRESSAIANVDAAPGVQLQGNSMTDPADIAAGLEGGAVFAPLMNAFAALAGAVAGFLMLFIMWLVGASITKAGWNLLKPRPETIRVRIKPKHLEAEPVYLPMDVPLGAAQAPPPPPA